MLPRNHSCDILGKNMAAFCPCSRSLPEAKVKRFFFLLLIPLVEETSKKPSIIVLTLMKIYNEKEQAKE